MKLRVVLEPSGQGGYSATVPALPGCISEGGNPDEALRNINWTYISDIVSGTFAAAERIDDATAVNLGTMERIRVIDAAREVMRLMGREARLVTRPDMPTGPYNRVADNALAKRLLAWEPQVMFKEGLQRTIDWYVKSRDRNQVAESLEGLLAER